MTHRLFDDPQLLLAETRALRQLAGRLVSDPGAADDLVQGTWLTALTRRAREQQDGGWLRGVLRNLMRQEQRGNRRRQTRERAAAHPEHMGEQDDHLERLEALQAVVSAVRGLPEPYRGTVMARFFEERQLKEIAESQGLPLATVRTRLHRALEMLRESLDRRFGGKSQDWRCSLLLLGVAETLIPPLMMSGKLKLAALILVTLGLVGAGFQFLVPVGEQDRPAPDPEPTVAAVALAGETEISAPNETDEGLAAEGVAADRVAVELLVAEDLEIPKGSIAVAGWVRDDGGKPLGHARVWTVNKETYSSADGRYQILLRANRTVGFLHAVAEGHASMREIFKTKGEGSRVKVDFALRKEFRISGQVHDSKGSPVEGVEVDTFYNVGKPVMTAADGSYVLTGLDPGRPKHALTAIKVGFIRSNSDVRTLGREVTQNMVMERGNVVEGVVTNLAGEPLIGAAIYIGFDPNAFDRLDTKTDDEGVFVFPAVRPGSRKMVVQAKGHAAASLVIVLPPRPAILEPMEIVLESGRSLRGRVLDQDDQPVQGVSLHARHFGKWIERSTSTDREGRFQFDHLPEQELSLSVNRQGYLNLRQHEVADGESRTEVRLQRAGRIVGRVLNGRDHRPLEDFRVRFVAPDLKAGETRLSSYAATWSREGKSFSDADGRWSTVHEDLQPGAVIGLEISAKGFATTRFGRAIVSAEAEPEALVVELLPGTRVFGSVLAGGAPVDGAKITLLRGTRALREDYSDQTHDRILTHSDGAGSFEFVNTGAGEIHLAVEHEGHAFALHGPIQLAPGQSESEERIELRLGWSLSGELRDATGKPRPAVEMVLQTTRVVGLSNRNWRQQSDSQGRFQFEHLGQGSYRLRDSYRLGRREGWTVASEVAIANFHQSAVILQPSSERGVIQGQLRAPVPLAEPIQVSLNGPVQLREIVEDGRFRFAHLPAGKYVVSASRVIPGEAKYEAKAEVNLQADASEQVLLQLKRER